jgi:thiamine-monophosphate kinase
MGEFTFINMIKSLNNMPLSVGTSNALGFDDDVCIIAHLPDGVLIATKDIITQGTHFFAQDDLSSIIKKAIRTNISDITAKGAKPYSMMLGLCLPDIYQGAESLKIISDTILSESVFYHVPLLGGDTVKSDILTISVTLFGICPDMPPLRQNAQIGDNIYVTNILGLSASGLKIRQGMTAVQHQDLCLNRYLIPEPPLLLGQDLFPYMHASCDISDGLLQDLNHILSASTLNNKGQGIGARIFTDKIPHLDIFDDKDFNLELSMTGGDDYEILFTSKKIPEFLSQISEKHAQKITHIGEITNGHGIEFMPKYHGKQTGFSNF